jgi:DNA-binding SARP family transcriptional activator
VIGTDAQVEFRLLGPLAVLANGHDVTPRRPQQRCLLTILLLRAGHIVSTDELVDSMWGDTPPATARTALHGHVSAMRKLLGTAAIETQPSGYVLRVPPDQIDLARFEATTSFGSRSFGSAHWSNASMRTSRRGGTASSSPSSSTSLPPTPCASTCAPS